MNALPPADEWSLAVQHSRANPEHVLGPYEEPDDGTGISHMDCSCGWDSAAALARVRELTP